VGGIETVKVNIMLRIYSNQWHVYAGLAILNPSARVQIDQYARSVTELFKIMLAGDQTELRARVYRARDTVFPQRRDRAPILLSEDVLDQFSLGKKPSGEDGHLPPTNGSGNGNGSRSATMYRPPGNSHLSLLAMVDCWAHLDIQPFVHLELAATPIFRMWLGVAESLFRSQERLDAAIQAAVRDVSHRSDDLEFVVAARGWSQCVSFGSFELYKQRFTQTASFFSTRFEEATKIGSAMLQTIMESEIKHR
jgi:prephenate dehydrogenase (NADP+)